MQITSTTSPYKGDLVLLASVFAGLGEITVVTALEGSKRLTMSLIRDIIRLTFLLVALDTSLPQLQRTTDG